MTPRLRSMALAVAAAVLGLATGAHAAPAVQGPQNGTLIIAGGGQLGPEIVGRFIALAGGPGAEIVVIPTASGDPSYGPDCECLKIFKALGATHLTLLHTSDRVLADSTAFTAPLRRARSGRIPRAGTGARANRISVRPRTFPPGARNWTPPSG